MEKSKEISIVYGEKYVEIHSRGTQNLTRVTSCGFKSHLLHSKKGFIPDGMEPFCGAPGGARF